jgi:membrane protein DedA with SNARE-associated domain
MFTASDITIIISAITAQALKEIGIPFPGVVQGALLYGGWQIATGHPLTGLALLAGVLAGSLAGASVAYWISRYLGLKVIDRFGKYLRVTPASLEKANRRLSRNAFWTILLLRIIFLFKFILSLSAGILKISFARFISAFALAILVWEVFYLGLGAAGQQVFHVFPWPQGLAVWQVILILVVTALFIRLSIFWIMRSHPHAFYFLFLRLSRIRWLRRLAGLF